MYLQQSRTRGNLCSLYIPFRTVGCRAVGRKERDSAGRRQFCALPFDGATKVLDRVRASPSGDANEKKEVDMRRKLTWVLLFSAAILVTVLYHAKKALATPSQGFTSTTLSQGRFGPIN